MPGTEPTGSRLQLLCIVVATQANCESIGSCQKALHGCIGAAQPAVIASDHFIRQSKDALRQVAVELM